MRTIKFRAWDGQEMIYPDEYKSASGYVIKSSDILSRFENVMQFTGLHDINGREIYEGDVVSYSNPYSKKDYKQIVKWDNLFAGFALFEKNNEWAKESDWVNIINIEVLGNIHENPELL